MRRLSVLLFLALVGGVALAAYALQVSQVKVTGLRTLDAADVIRASGIEPGQRILWIRLSAATRRIEKMPAVEDATATRSLPGTVLLEITERVALAKLDTSPDIVTDEQGHLFSDVLSEGAAKRLPALAGWHATRSRKGSWKDLDEGTGEALRAYASFPDALRARTRRIVVRPTLTLVLDHGIQVRFGRLTGLRKKALAALAVLKVERAKPVAYVDVRVPSMPIVGPVPTPTPPPTPGPETPAPVAGTTTPTPRRTLGP